MEAQFRNVPDGLWEQIAPLIPARRKNTLRGFPPVPDREVLAGIVYRLRTGCQWKALPREFGPGSTCHRRLKEWCAAGVFTKVFSRLLKFYDRRRGIQWKWSSLDSAMVKAPKGGTSRAPTRPTARKVASSATFLTDGLGVPLAAEITGANVHDKWLVGQMLDAVVLRAPRGPRRPEHLCLDKGYRRPRPPDHAAHQAHRRAAAPGLRPGQASQMGRGADQRLAQTASAGCSCAGNESAPTTPASSTSPLRSSRSARPCDIFGIGSNQQPELQVRVG